MAEREAAVPDLDHSTLLRLVQGVEAASQQPLGELEPHPGRHDGQLLAGGPTLRPELPQPGHHSVGDSTGDAARRGGQHLRHEERVTRGEFVQ